MARFRVVSRPQREVLSIDHFKGVDFYNAPGSVAASRASHSVNMIRDQVGKVRKRMGYQTVMTMPGRINGSYSLGNKRLVHAGTALYEVNLKTKSYTIVLPSMANKRSFAMQFHSDLYIFDGTSYLRYNGQTVALVMNQAYIPTILISRRPEGGGVLYEAINLCQPRWIESFLGTEKATQYQLSSGSLGSQAVHCQVMNSAGQWEARTEGTDYTVNRTTGVVTFTKAPGAPPVTGVDNVRLTPYKRRANYPERISRCTAAIQYGVGGSPDRLFVGGNPDFPNMDFFSAVGDPSYFGDTDYAVIGQDDGIIMGYAVISNMLATYRSKGADGRSIVVRTGVLEEGRAAFPIVNTLQGEGVVSQRSFGTLGKDPLFLTRSGIYTITAEELTGEKYSQHRSLYIFPSLQEEQALANAFAFVWRDFYMLAVGDKIYVLDGLQKDYAKGVPYSSYQYECYLQTGIGARVLWEEEGSLYFGTEGGTICAFYNDSADPASYNDDGRPIEAIWDTADFSGQLFYKSKTFRYLAVCLAGGGTTSISVLIQGKDGWKPLIESRLPAAEGAPGSLITYGSKIKIRKTDRVRFRLKNDAVGQPFGLHSIALEYEEQGNYRRGGEPGRR